MAAIEFRLKNIKSPSGLTATLAELIGSIDATTVESFASVMDKLLEKGVKHLVLDCNGVKYINSTGLGILLKYVDAFNERGGAIAFSRVPQKVMLVMEMLGFNALFTIVADEAMALQHFSGAAVPPVSVPVTPDPSMERAAPRRPAEKVVQAPVAAVPVAVFPLSLACPRCRLSLKLPAPGRYKCPKCTSIAQAEGSGEMKFFASRRAKPIEVTLPAIPHLADALTGLVSGAARQAGFAEDRAATAARAVVLACRSVAEHACGNDPNAIFHMIIIPNGRQLTVKISDYGTPLSFPPQGPSADARFGETAKVMQVEHAQNSAGGNLFTLTESAD